MLKHLGFLFIYLVFALPFAFARDKTQSITITNVQGTYLAIVQVDFTLEAEDAIMGAFERKEKTAQNTIALSPFERSLPMKSFYRERGMWRNGLSWKLFTDRFLAYLTSLHTLLSTTFMLTLISILFPYNRPNSPFRPNH